MTAAPPAHQKTWQRKLARQARLRFVGGLCTALPGMVEQLGSQLTTMLSKPGGSEGRTHMSLSAAAQDLNVRQQAWVDSATKLLRQTLLTADQAPATNSIATLELVTDEAMEGKIVASRMGGRVLEAVSVRFDSVRRVTQFLEGDDLTATDILRPEVVCQKLIEAWEEAMLGRSTFETIQPEFCDRLIVLTNGLYASVQAFYDEQNAASEKDLQVNRIKRTEGDAPAAGSRVGAMPTGFGGSLPTMVAPVPGGMPPGMLAAGGMQAGVPGMGYGAMSQARQKASGVLAQLRGFLGNVGFGGGGGSAGGGAGVPSGGAVMVSPGLQQALVATHTAMHTAWFQTVAADFGGDPGQVIAPVAVAMRQQSSALKQVASSDEEKAIIEIIALMFQSILNEDRIPAGIRIWFARLQVPVLRVALAEPAFFNDTEHPARQLIDRMGACVLGFEASALNGTALETEVKRVVQVIEQYPETGSRVFQLVLKEFQKFLEKNLSEQAPRAQELVSLAQQVEQKETLAIQYTIQLRDMLLSVPVGNEIREFLYKQWSDVLAMSAIRYGTDHEHTDKFKQAALDLVWSASAKASKEERAKVIRQLPKLQTVLRQGLSLANVVDDRQNEVIKALMDVLAGAFLSKTAEVPRERIDEMAERLKHLEEALDDVVTEEYPLSADSIELMLGIDASSIHVIADNDVEVNGEVLEWAKTLLIGNWFLLDHNGAPLQVQYVWHSQHKQLHLFAALNGLCFLFQLRRMAHYLQVGLLAPRDVEGITARAARDALAKIEANPERLLQ